MKILDGFEQQAIEKAVTLLQRGELVVFPTETVYGIGADAQNPYAVAKVFEVKGRPRFDPLIVHIGKKEWIYNIAKEVPEIAVKYIERFWPGPLTILLKKKELIPDIVTAGLETVGIRMPSHNVALRLINGLGRPVAAPSANPFGYISPTKALHVKAMFDKTIDLVLDGGDCSFGIESTIISFTGDSTIIHRHGGISMEELSEIGGSVRENKRDNICEAPGELPYHYAPRRPLKIIDSPIDIKDIKHFDSALLAFKTPKVTVPCKYIKVLSTSGDIREAAANFFSYLIELDHLDIEIIYAEKIPDTGLGKAMMERLAKASKRHTALTH